MLINNSAEQGFESGAGSLELMLLCHRAAARKTRIMMKRER